MLLLTWLGGEFLVRKLATAFVLSMIYFLGLRFSPLEIYIVYASVENFHKFEFFESSGMII